MADNKFNVFHKDPCFCTCGCSSNTDKSPCPPTDKPGDSNCLYFCDFIVKTIDGVGPCKQVGTTDIYSVNNETSVCQNPPTFTILNFDETLLSDVSIDAAGILTWTTCEGTACAGKYAEVQIKAKCINEEGNCLEHIFCGQIGIKDECACVDCEGKCNECNPCTGECEQQKGEISIVESGQISII